MLIDYDPRKSAILVKFDDEIIRIYYLGHFSLGPSNTLLILLFFVLKYRPNIFTKQNV